MNARLFRTCLALALSFSSADALAAPSEGEAAVALAKEKFQLGRVAYGTSDYLSAVDEFQAAYGAALGIEDEAFKNEVFYAIMFNLGRAHHKAYALDKDIVHLRQAKDLFTRYVDAAPHDHEDVSALLVEVEAALATAESTTAREPAVGEADQDDPGVPPPGESGEPSDRAGQADQGDKGDKGDKAKTPPLALAGYGLIGGSAAGLGLMGAGLAMGGSANSDYDTAPDRAGRDAATKRGQTANVLAIAGGVTAGVLLAAGVALVVVGSNKRGKAQALLVPAPSPDGLGLSIVGRF